MQRNVLYWYFVLFVLIVGSYVGLILIGTGPHVHYHSHNSTCNCSTDNQTGIQTIDGEGPDIDGDFLIVGGANVLVTPIPNGLLLDANASCAGQCTDGRNGSDGTNATVTVAVLNLSNFTNVTQVVYNATEFLVNITITENATFVQTPGPPGPKGDTGDPGANGTDCDCNNAIVWINGIGADANHSFAIDNGPGILITPQANGFVVESTLQQGLRYINGLAGNANDSFSLLPGAGIGVQSSGSSVTISNTGLLYLNGLAPSANNSISVVPGIGIGVQSSGSAVTISNTGLLYINGLAGNANNSISVLPGTGIGVQSSGSAVTISNTGLLYLNGLAGDANNSVSVLAGAGISVESSGASSVTIGNTGVLYINGLPADANNTFTIQAGDNISITLLANGIVINGVGAIGPQGEQGEPGANGTCGCNGTGIFTINSQIPDGNANFDVLPGAGIAIIDLTNAIMINSTLQQGLLYINGLPGNANHSFSVLAGTGISVQSSGSSVTISNTGLLYINGLAGNANNSISVLPGAGIGVQSSGSSVTISNTGVLYINGLPADSNNSFSVMPGAGITITPGTNSITIDSSLAQGIVQINNVSGDSNHRFTLQQQNHILITAITNGLNVATDGTPYNNASTLVARDANGDFAARYITACWYKAELCGDAGPLDPAFSSTVNPTDPFLLFYIDHQGGMFWSNGDDGYDAAFQRVNHDSNPVALQVQDNLEVVNGLQVGFYARVGSTLKPQNTGQGDLTSGRLLVYGIDSFYDTEYPLGTGADAPYVQFIATMTDANASTVTGQACGFNATYKVTPGGISDGTFVGAALGLILNSPGADDNATIVGHVAVKAQNQMQGSAPVVTLAALWAINQVTTDRPSLNGIETAGASPLGNNYVVGDLITVTGCSGSGGVLRVASINGGGGVTAFTVVFPGINYVVSGGCSFTGGSGSGASVVITAVAQTLYSQVIGAQVQAFTAQGTNATPPLGMLIGVQIQSSFLSSSPNAQRPTQQFGVVVRNQALASATNAALYVEAFTGNGANYGFYVNGFTGTTQNYGGLIGSMAGGSGATNVGLRIDPPSGGNSTTSAALVLQHDDSTAAVGGILWGSGADSVHVNLYRVAAGQLKTDAALLVAQNARVGTYERVGSLSAPLNTNTGDFTALRAVIGTDETLGETTTGYATTVKINGILTSANASLDNTFSCGLNASMRVQVSGSTSGTFLGTNLVIEHMSDTTTITGMRAAHLFNRMGRAGPVTTLIGASTGNQVYTNVPSTNGLLSVAVTAAGTGYAVGNQLTVTGGGGSGGTVLVATIGGGGTVTAVTMERPGTGYSVGTGRATTGGSGSGCTINIVSVGSTTYTTLYGAWFTAYSASGTYATPTLGTVIGAQINGVNLGSSAQAPRPSTVAGLVVAGQIEGSSTNTGIQIGGGSPATSGTVNYNINVAASLSGTNCTNHAINLVMASATGGSSANYGLRFQGGGGAGAAFNVGLSMAALTAANTNNIAMDIGAPTGSGSTNIGFRMAAPSGGSFNLAMQFSSQTTTEEGGILFGSGADSVHANLYRSATSTLKCDGDLTARHAISVSSTPGIAASTGAGTSPTISVAGTDQAMQVTLTTGSSPSTSATIFTVTYTVAFPVNMYPVFSPANANAAALSGTSAVRIGGTGTTTFTMVSGSAALAGTTQYIWNVVV